MKKLFTLLTLTLMSIGSAWADDEISCSAYLSATAGSPTVTDCTFKYFGKDGDPASETPAGSKITVSGVDYYYAKMNNNANYYEITLNKTVGGNNYNTFKAGDEITVYLYTNSADPGYILGKTAQTKVSLSGQTTKTIVTAPHTLTAAEIESDGTIRIYRNSSKTYFAGISVSGTRATATYTVTFNAGTNGTCGTASLTEVSAGAGVTLPAVTPNSGYAFNGWYTAASEGTKVGDAGDTYNPTANITVYAQYSVQSAPGISIDDENPSTPRGIAVTFTATTTGAPVPTVTWYQSVTAITSGGTEKGTGTTYKPDVTTEGTYYYYAVASNGVSPDATSELITLTVINPDIDRTGYNTYYVAVDETAFGGESVFCDNITMVYDNVTYNMAVEDNMINSLNANYVASISCGTNNWGVTFTPTVNGVLSVGVVINSGKTFSITNATSFSYEDKDGNSGTIESNTWTPTDKEYAIITLAVEAGTSYKFSVSGSKMSLYGFEFVPLVTIDLTKEYTSYVTTDALDFTGLELKAFVATGTTASSVTLTEVTAVPAGTPLVLKKGSAASYDVPVAASAAAPAKNLLRGSATESYTVTSGVTAYGLSDGKFVKLNEGTIPAGKAYLLASDFTSAPELAIEFNGETTSISEELSVKSEEFTNSVFDLQGRRVAHPTKGLYIVNGRKVVIK